MQNLPAILEAILFACAKMERPKKLARLLGTEEKEVQDALTQLKKDYKKRGLKILEKDGEVQLATDPQYASYLRRYWQKDLREKLSSISLEVLAIIAYEGPISRYQIEEIRGVNSIFVLRNLLRRGLIERQIEGKKVKYAITADFLRHLGLTSATGLPNYHKWKKNFKFQNPKLNSNPKLKI